MVRQDQVLRESETSVLPWDDPARSLNFSRGEALLNPVMLSTVFLIIALLIPTVSYQRPVVVPSSNILQELAQRKKKQPAITSKELAVIGNELLEKRGFDYMFNVCDTQHMRKSTDSTANYQWSLTSGGKRNFRFTVFSSEEALCGECGSSRLPSVQVTKKEMVLVAEGKRYRVRRPASFNLDEVELVDATMKKVLRTWQQPYESIPIGISADGTKLYLSFWTEYELDGLVLELSETGALAFRDRTEVQMIEGKLIEDYPKDPNNAYLSFIRFDAGDKTYIIRFSAPCT